MTEEPQPVFAPVVASDVVVPDAVAAFPAAAPARAPKGRRGLVIALVLSLIAVVALGSLSAYLWSVHSQYVAQNEQLRSTAASLGDEVASRRAELDDLQSQLDDSAAQLADAKDTINGLANSEAQAGDDRQALIDVADGLQQCADARQTLIGHLKEANMWTPESLRASEASITAYCDKVSKAYDEVVDD